MSNKNLDDEADAIWDNDVEIRVEKSPYALIHKTDLKILLQIIEKVKSQNPDII